MPMFSWGGFRSLGGPLNDQLAEASDGNDDLLGQNRWGLSESVAGDELFGSLLDDERHIDGVTQARSADDEAVVLHNHGWCVFASRTNRIGKLHSPRHDEGDAGNLADECGLRRNRQERKAGETQGGCLGRM